MTSTKKKLAVEHWRRRGVLHDGPDQGPGKTKDTVSQVNGAVREDHFVVSGRSRGYGHFNATVRTLSQPGTGLDYLMTNP